MTAPTEASSILTAAHPSADWMFLGIHVTQLTSDAGPMVVAEALLPAGASPPFHRHDDLDDSFYVLDGTMVVRCGDEVSLARPGTWVPFPATVPHTFRVIGQPARILLVHANDSFMKLVKAIGHPLRDGEQPTTTGGPSPETLATMMAEHGIQSLGPAMEADEAEAWLRRLGERTGCSGPPRRVIRSGL